MRRAIVFSLIGVVYLIFSQPLSAQQPQNINTSDIRDIDVNAMSDSQIGKFLNMLDEKGISLDEFEQMALLRGARPDQIAQLKNRINEYKNHPTLDLSDDNGRNRIRQYNGTEDLGKDEAKTFTNPVENKKAGPGDMDDLFSILDQARSNLQEKAENQIFGMSLFQKDNISFEPILNIPTPEDYQLGPGDELIIDIWGVAEHTYDLVISPEGSIIIPNIGPVSLSGQTIREGTGKLKHELTRIYSGLGGSHPNTFMNLSLKSVRSIKVNIVGEVAVPGTYTLPSLASVFNALYAAGGPSSKGSLREIDLIRENKTIARIDFYRFLVYGMQENNIGLRDQDVILLKPYQSRVRVEGEVKRPGIYEMKEGENLSNLVNYTGGFTGKAYKRRLKIYRQTDREKKILDIPEEHFLSEAIHDGDRVVVDSVLNRYENRVEITGAVYRPGEYALDDNMTLANLVSKAEGLRQDAFPNRGEIFRLNEDLTVSVIPFGTDDIKNETDPIVLHREDLVLIPSINDLRENLTVQILGEVNKPGLYPFVRNATVEDLILQAGGLLESASFSRIEIARRVKDPNTEKSGNEMAKIYNFNINPGLKIPAEASDFILQPFDQVFVRRSPGYEVQSTVTIEGEVQFPGQYSLSKKDEKISDLILRAGGLTSEAYVKGARLNRKLTIEDKEKFEQLDELALQANDTTSVMMAANNARKSAIGIKLERILADPGSEYNLILKGGDQLIIPKELQTVRLNGAVLQNTTVRYDKTYSFGHYISSAGGFAENAKKSKAYIIYPNGSIDRTRKVLFFNNYPDVEPGSEIYVPLKPEKNKVSPQQAISISSAIASMALVLVTLIGRL